MSKAQIEKRWGVKIIEDGYYWFGKYVKLYNIYSADGCSWEKGLRTLKAVEKECKEWNDALLIIKKNHR